MASGGSAPAAPDYTGAAQATAAGNQQNLQYQTQANRPDQVTPWGTSTWTQGTNADGTGNNQWTQNLTLTPAEQQALNSQQSIQQGQSNLAQTLQGQAASTMAGGFNAPSFSSYMNGVNGVDQNFSGFSPTGVGGVNQQMSNAGMYTRGDQGVSQNLYTGANPLNQNLQTSANTVNQSLNSSGQNVNTNAAGAVAGAGSANTAAPTFSDATAQAGATAAYNAQMGLLQPEMTQDTTNLDSQLRLQGLTPGTEAYNNAMQNLQRTQAETTTTAANNAVLTGNNEANQNYASALAGYNSGNAAQQQAYGQAANTFALGNSALGQQYGQDANTFNANNTAQNQAYTQGLNTFDANNAASAQQAATATNTYNAQNAARSQALTNSLSQYQAALQGQSAYNTAQGQAYNQALAGYGANTTAQQNSNAAQQQAYAQGQGSYATAYQSALNNYLQPLNSMNAVLSGQQVSNPSMPSFASAGYTPGADLSGAANSTGSYNQSVYNANQASASGTNSAMAGLGSAAIMAMAMY